MKKLEELMSLCKHGMFISINEHRDNYQSVEEFLLDQEGGFGLISHDDIDDDTRQRMVVLDTVVELQCYPDTPNGFYVMFHYDIGKVVEDMIATIVSNRRGLEDG